MRKVTSCLAGVFALWGISAAPASAVQVRFELEEIGTLLAAQLFRLDVAGFEGFLLFDLVDTDEDGMLDAGTLVDMRLKAFGPVLDDGSFGTEPGDLLTLGLILPGEVELLQIPDGTGFLFPDPLSPPENPTFLPQTASNPRGTLVASVETPGVERFTFDDAELLSVEGAPNTGVATCAGTACPQAINNLGELPFELSGPQAPIAVGDVVLGKKTVFFDIVGLDTIESAPATLTGRFEFFLGAFSLEFDILSATSVPEPGAGLGIAASLGTLALLRRRRAAQPGVG